MTHKTVLITGASSGIGRALAGLFAQDGYGIIAVASHEEGLQRAAAELRSAGAVAFTPLVKDLTRAEAPQEIYAAVQAAGLRVDVLVNDAGVGQQGEFKDSDLDKDISIIRLNVEALVRLTRLFLPDMLARRSGRILNLGSVAGFQPGPLLAVYHASKAFVVSFSESLANELEGSGVTLTCLCPGPTDTDFFRKAEMEESRVVEAGALMDPEEVAQIGYGALLAGDPLVIPGLSNKVLTFTRRFTPQTLQAKFNRKLYEQNDRRTES